MSTRRTFLRGLIAAPAIVAASNLMPISVRTFIPSLVGDGIADDTAALQAMINSAAANRTWLDLHNRTYRISRALLLPHETRITRGRIVGPGDEPIFDISVDAHVTLSDMALLNTPGVFPVSGHKAKITSY
jgi:hypothetical protein